jgi:LysM repeat protein
VYTATDTARQTPGSRRRRTSARVVRVARATRDHRSRQGRPLTAVGLFLLVAFSLIAVGALPTLADGASAPAASHAVTVSAADTLWAIAKANRVPGMTTADMVEEIRRINGLTPGRNLQPGAVVKVPVATDDEGAVARR